MIGVELLACAPNVAPHTLQEIIRVESAFNPIAVNVNIRKVNGKRISFSSPIKIKSKADAIYVTKLAINAGHSVDMGYMQINSTNLKTLGYSVDEMFNDPCKNIKAGASVLTAFYSKAIKQYPNEQTALKAALSAYNTGNFKNGFSNGYVARYVRSGKSMRLPEYTVVQTQTPQPTQNVNNPFAGSSGTSIFSTQQNKEQIMNTKDQNMTVKPLVSQSLQDAETPGVQVQYTAAQAAANGAFQETALSEADAWQSNAEIAQVAHATAILVSGKNVK